MVFNDVQPGIQVLGRRPLTLRDIITVGTTTSDTVEYVRETSETNAAAPVAEATASSGATGTKPESAMAFEKVTTPVRAIGHWVPATKRALSDAGQLRTIIDSFLRDGLEMTLEDQMVLGDGQGENLTGIGQTSNIQTQAWDTDEFITTRKAKTKVRVVGRSRPNAYLMNPYNWETIETKQNKDGIFYAPSAPFGVTVPTLWGLPVVECEAVPDGVAYCGDFSKAVLWDREQASVAISDSHADFFIRGLVAIVAEMRAAFGVVRPKAFVEIDLSERS
jgi:HK97 family phage major capsid protein